MLDPMENLEKKKSFNMVLMLSAMLERLDNAYESIMKANNQLAEVKERYGFISGMYRNSLMTITELMDEYRSMWDWTMYVVNQSLNEKTGPRTIYVQINRDSSGRHSFEPVKEAFESEEPKDA